MKLHRLTILLEGAGRAVGVGVAGFVLGSIAGSSLAAREIVPLAGATIGIPLAIVFGLFAFAYEVAHYRHFSYEVTGDTLDITAGVFFRREREIPLGRVQNVDIERDLIARILQIAVVSIETAGGGETEAQLRYVGVPEARRVQEEIRTRKRSTTATEDDGAGRREEHIFELDDGDLLLLSVLSFDARLLSVLVVAIPMIRPYLPAIDTPSGVMMLLFTLGGLLVSALAIWGLSAAATFVRFYGFTLQRVGDDLRYERGLIQRYDGSIPIDKIQTLVIEENVLMRRFGYASLSIETAGYAPGSTPSGGSEAAIPLAHRGTLVELAQTIEPFEDPALERPPKRARRRYAARYSIVVGVVTGLAYLVSHVAVAIPWYLPLTLLVIVPFAADRKWRHRGWALGDGHGFTRNGFWRRRIHVVPEYRLQTIIERQTVFQRRWHLGSVVMDTASSRGLTGGDASAVDVDADVAASLSESLRDRLQAALVRRSRDSNRD